MKLLIHFVSFRFHSTASATNPSHIGHHDTRLGKLGRLAPELICYLLLWIKKCSVKTPTTGAKAVKNSSASSPVTAKFVLYCSFSCHWIIVIPTLLNNKLFQSLKNFIIYWLISYCCFEQYSPAD
jgi:hypothetical protein